MLRDPDDILFLLGNPGRFQVIQIVLLSTQFIPTGMIDLMPIFYNLQPAAFFVSNVSDAQAPAAVLRYREIYRNGSSSCKMVNNVSNELMYVYEDRQWSTIADVSGRW